jgi:hypothetical protein
MKLPKPNIGRKSKVAGTLVLCLALMIAGYFIVGAGISYANRQLDSFSTGRVRSRHLIPEAMSIKEVPVITTADIKGQVNEAIAQNLGK